MKKLENKVAIVTGAASGLGKAIATLYASHGAKVLAADFNESALKVLKKESATNNQIKTIMADMAVAADIETMIKIAVKHYGTVDILVNNAGIIDDFSPVGFVTDANWERIMKINVEGPMRVMGSVLQNYVSKKLGSDYQYRFNWRSCWGCLYNKQTRDYRYCQGLDRFDDLEIFQHTQGA